LRGESGQFYGERVFVGKGGGKEPGSEEKAHKREAREEGRGERGASEKGVLSGKNVRKKFLLVGSVKKKTANEGDKGDKRGANGP